MLRSDFNLLKKKNRISLSQNIKIAPKVHHSWLSLFTLCMKNREFKFPTSEESYKPQNNTLYVNMVDI